MYGKYIMNSRSYPESVGGKKHSRSRSRRSHSRSQKHRYHGGQGIIPKISGGENSGQSILNMLKPPTLGGRRRKGTKRTKRMKGGECGTHGIYNSVN